MTMLGMEGTQPISKATFGCLKMLYMTISFWISSSSSFVMFGSKIFFTATGVPFS